MGAGPIRLLRPVCLLACLTAALGAPRIASASSLGWGSAGGCSQNIQTQDFGVLSPTPGRATIGAFGALPAAQASTTASGADVWVGCITSDQALATVTAQGTADMTDATGTTLPLADVAIGTVNDPPGTTCEITAAQQTAGACTLPADGATARTIMAGAPSGTNEIDWEYQLTLPGDQAAGDYANGQVTLTATAVADTPPTNTQLPAITGTPIVGDTLSVSTGTWTGDPTLFTYSYQWEDCSGQTCNPINGAASATYTPVADDDGETLEATVTATNSAGSATATAGPTTAVTQAPSSLTAPTLSTSTPVVGTPLSVSDGTWAADPPPSFSYQWARCSAGSCAPIDGATGAAYTPVAGDVGETLQATVTAKNSAGQGTATSAQTTPVIAGPPVNAALPGVSTRTAQQGTPETVDNGSWSNSPTNYSYQWEHCRAGTCAAIPGATAASYTPGPQDVGQTLRVQVTASNPLGSATAASNPTESVFPPAGAATDLQVAPAGGVDCTQQFVTGSDGDLYVGNEATKQIDQVTPTGTLTGYSIPSGASPCGLTLGPDGNIWFAAISPPTVGKLTPAGTITDFSAGTNTSPEGITTGPDGNLYFTEAGSNVVARLSTSGTITPFTTPIAGSQPGEITLGPDGALWFTEAQVADIGRMTTSGSFTEFPVDADHNNGIVTGSDDALWFTNTPNNEIDRLTTAGTLTRYPLPTAGAKPDGMAAGPDGALWFGQDGTPYVGRINTAGEITQWAVPSGGTPRSVTVGPDNFIWYDSTVSMGELAPRFAEAAPANTVRPTLSTATPVEGTPVSIATTGTWTNSPTAFLYQWYGCTDIDICSPIAGATNASYTPTASDYRHFLQAAVTAVNSAGEAQTTTVQIGIVKAPA